MKSIKGKRKGWFEFVKSIMRLAIKKSEFRYLGEEITEPSIIISNHVGTSAPLAWELYGNTDFRFWGASEMNSGLIALYKYQTRVFYHEKKHWNIHLARLFCLIASPLTNMFYKGLQLISTYRDARFRKSIHESLDTLEGGKSIVIFPEDSTKGYLDELEGFHHGFIMFAHICLKKGLDVPLFVTYYKKSERLYMIDTPIRLSELFAGDPTADEVEKRLLDRCNSLGRGDYDKEKEAEVAEIA